MSRPIKFRAWDKELLIMLPSDEMSCDKNFKRYGREATLDGFFKNPDYEIMQYSGLKDRNGKELYFDSDLVRLPEYEGFWIATQDNYGIPLFVRPDDLLKGQISFEDYFLSSGAKRNDDFEIVGNKFSYPELLKP